MRINNNIMAMNTYRQLALTNTSASKAMEKLSSGLRINRAGDDAAGLSISEKMRAQIRGLTMASKNAQDGISLIQTAEGALNETHAILQRMRELAVQAANDTNIDVDRQALQNEIVELVEEIDRIAQTTEFNKQNILVEKDPGSGVFTATLQVGANYGQSFTITIEEMSASALQLKGDSAGGTTPTVVTSGTVSAGGVDLTIDFGAANADLGEITITFDTTDQDDAVGASWSGNDLTITLKENGSYTAAQIEGFIKGASGAPTGFNSDAITLNATDNISADDFAGESVTINTPGTAPSLPGEYLIDVTSLTGANDALQTIDNAINKVSEQRSKLGAYQNRLEHTINNLDTAAENLQAAESRIRDVDMAKEIMEFTKNSILQQAATAMLAQANAVPQSVLQLLR
jgi:flagellin